jgi:hypothetical protein
MWAVLHVKLFDMLFSLVTFLVQLQQFSRTSLYICSTEKLGFLFEEEDVLYEDGMLCFVLATFANSFAPFSDDSLDNNKDNCVLSLNSAAPNAFRTQLSKLLFLVCSGSFVTTVSSKNFGML